jgi:hypothetical protein
MHVNIGMRTKHAMKGYGIAPFQLDSRGTMGVTNFRWVPELKRNVLSVSMIEKNGFDIVF